MIRQRHIDGRIMACSANGEEFRPGQTTLVFVHGAGGDHRLWERQYTALGKAFQVMAVDLPGHGASAGPGEEEAARYAEWLRGLLDGWGVARPVLIGHSLGAAVCLHFALRWGDSVAGLVTVGGGATMRVNPTFLAGLRSDPAGAMKLAAHYALAPANRERLAGVLEEGFSRTAGDVLYGDFLACDRLEIEAEIGRIGMPTLILCGAEDKMTPPSLSALLRDGIAGARLSMIEGAGHMVMLEDPEALNGLLIPFIRSLPAKNDPSPR